MRNCDKWGRPYNPIVDAETRRRIQLAMWAYAYEIGDGPLVSDAVFDETASAVDLTVDTRRPDMDAFFRKEFDAYTGSWIWKHPELHIIGHLVRTVTEHRERT